ncbi:energy-coupling factor transporter transmembrane protein EcfT [Selenomonas sp. TAMA-11512]|uniref:energy-coupling factor transporter transmembrane component T family protein n=1 Tax=Selenomonas sp. TAMA-11512 TaxID=3095337 RepID=UPI00308A9D53|nr:energy-coupling factor transporter transmembrane protein EcfT [Selenomonas sp. TAMA-11512]
MLNGMTLGQYLPVDSVLHRLDPRAKMFLLLLVLFAVFFYTSPELYALYTVVLLLLAGAGRVPLRLLLSSVRPILPLIVFTFIVHLFTMKGTPLVTVAGFSVTMEGVRHGFFITYRLVLLLMYSALLTFTTSPLLMTDAIEWMLSPFRRIGVPAHELAMMMTIALRFVPTLLEEAEKIMLAQRARGVDFSGSIWHRIKSFIPILVPLFISSFRRADALAMAMEARCYTGGEGRTRTRELAFRRQDGIAAIAVLALFVLAAVMNGGGDGF